MRIVTFLSLISILAGRTPRSLGLTSNASVWNAYVEIVPHLTGYFEDTNDQDALLAHEYSCSTEVILNATAQGVMPLFRGSLTRCPSPWYVVREIYPEHVSWSPTRGSPDDSGEDLGDDQERVEGSPLSTDDEQHVSKMVEPGETTKPQFLSFLLYLQDEPFSAELDAVVEACAPAFPRIRFVKGEGTTFASIVAKYSVRAFPRLLLFRDGLLIGKYHGRRNTAELTAYLANQTNMLPASRIRSQPRVTSVDESNQALLLLLSTAYVVLRLLYWIYMHWYRKDDETVIDLNNPRVG